ncbi:MAG: cyclic nucleotide-binding domain-containing protein [Kordiimonadaceae bacterium]|nr:cyclic nucleotide-binding domain-containing protein [Kordiimonadaceae bacterium]
MTQNELTMGSSVDFSLGDVIYKQDSESVGVYMILEGQVEIWRQDESDCHHIASIGAGELLGEVSVIEQAKHSVTAKASKPTQVLFIEADAFRRSFADPLVRHVVTTLAARLKSSYSGNPLGAIKASTVALPQKSDHPTIEGLSRLVANKFLSFVEVTEFPFLVGNALSKAPFSIATANSLLIPLPGTHELANNHFELIMRDGALCVRDLGGPHGTIVNGEVLSRYSLRAIAQLKLGKNEIVAGGAESPVRFAVTVPES